MKTSFSRNFFTYAAIFLAALLLVGIFFQLMVKDYLESRAVEGLKNDCGTIAQVASAYHADEGLAARDFLVNLSVATKVSGADAVICDADGKLLLCSDAPLGCKHRGLQISDAGYLQKIRQGGYVVSSGRLDGLYADSRYVVSTAITDSATKEIIGIVVVSSPTASTVAVLKWLSRSYLLVSLLVVLVAVAVMTFYARKNTDPLRGMAKTAIKFGHGDLKARANVPEGAPEEIRELALAFNNMAASLEKSEYQRTEFVANVSHELKTPMTTIGGYLDGMLDGTIPPEKHRYYMQIVSDETKRLSRLVRSMLDISRLQEQDIPEEQKNPFDLAECAGQVLLTFEQKITGKNLQVQVQMPEHPVYVLANEDYITQVIYNLVDNAVKFCPEGKELGIRLTEGGNKAYLTVYNDGQTIPPEELSLVFDRFHKLDKSRSQNRDGWGLGLYIVKTIICRHGEDISVSSRNDRTEFTFTLPLSN